MSIFCQSTHRPSHNKAPIELPRKIHCCLLKTIEHQDANPNLDGSPQAVSPTFGPREVQTASNITDNPPARRANRR
ncbi:hypothetical protein PGTUg99_000055 [Puccinia graminis f. sp. tritici]|uniref:Uncharacterized protein n=1 Tax=Puccinia graminis f. sp. tritici TaxID=56615 RepID=A0A5B0RLI8_PUCGR|nr:hypothetical protein PGTUg99_000055 [Puccinia graminis f. sp. tritici]